MKKKCGRILVMFIVTIIFMLCFASCAQSTQSNSHISDISETSQISEVSEISEISEISEVSEVSEVPEVPETPEISQVSEIPVVSEISQFSQTEQSLIIHSASFDDVIAYGHITKTGYPIIGDSEDMFTKGESICITEINENEIYVFLYDQSVAFYPEYIEILDESYKPDFSDRTWIGVPGRQH